MAGNEFQVTHPLKLEVERAEARHVNLCKPLMLTPSSRQKATTLGALLDLDERAKKKRVKAADDPLIYDGS